MKRSQWRSKSGLYFYLAILSIIFTACAPAPPLEQQHPAAQLKTVTLDSTVKLKMGQTVYVPIYSHIYTEDQTRRMDLTATLSIRNTDLVNPMIVTLVSYYDSNGRLVRKYLEKPVELGPLASTDFVVNRTDTSGGSGANFIVEWAAEQRISEPVIEAVMIYTLGNQGISFISNGRVIKTRAAEN
jgi:hypothetical protein